MAPSRRSRRSGPRTSAASSAACATPRSPTCTTTRATGSRSRRTTRASSRRSSRRQSGGGYDVEELDHEKDTFVHEIEVGDLDGDGIVEIYATPSEPNKLDGSEQTGHVTRYVPAKKEGRFVVADLGHRHAKEILVRDVDGDGRDELYVAVEARTEVVDGQTRIVEPVEIRRYDAGTDPKGGVVIATIDDRLCRFLTSGDLDGDGKREIVAAAFKSGLWLLRPGQRSEGDLEDGVDRREELRLRARVAAHRPRRRRRGRALRRERRPGRGAALRLAGRPLHKEVIHSRKPAGSAFTWNIMPVPVELVK
jgi:hypothetical protein